jgi:hypothetical protein
MSLIDLLLNYYSFIFLGPSIFPSEIAHGMAIVLRHGIHVCSISGADIREEAGQNPADERLESW